MCIEGKKDSQLCKADYPVLMYKSTKHKCSVVSISALPHFFNYFLFVREETHDKKCVG